ncbi:ATP-binding protein [Pelomonas sp. CA6]|uniref:sensor histidine kinase n=1 Tax=Pelomonas sp. CA6 TaxID=2907999 RepID=UPI001F4C46D0|nr:ATP-binding protein [Pelomonas sp. CA6]MCH7344309.1 ATP-binding protein [Pelomonas sp. CA6]
MGADVSTEAPLSRLPWPDTQDEVTRARLAGGAFRRLYLAFMGARAVLGLALVGAQVLTLGMAGRGPGALLYASLAYALLALFGWALARRGRPEAARLSVRQWWASIGLDLGWFGVLHALDAGALSYGALFVLPVLMASVLTPRLFALAAAAVATLVLLGVALWSVALGLDSGARLPQSGILACGLFLVSLLSSELANRLAREERVARGSMAVARQQAELNRLVIDEMQEGVLVVDRRGMVRAANPEAMRLLFEAGPRVDIPFSLEERPAWGALQAVARDAHRMESWPEAGRDLPMDFGPTLQRSVRARVRHTHRPEVGEDLCVMFLEDSRKLQARIRQEKLAAMGRVSAGIAHEIRNPLSAIAQANALLAEESGDPRQQQLLDMVAANVQRLKRIVDDVMEVAPGATPAPQPVELERLVRDCCDEWLRTGQLPGGPDGPLHLELPLPGGCWVSFDPEHLRRVLINLLDNGLRHAIPGPGCVRVTLRPEHEDSVRMTVASRGAAIPAEVERHLFEPFFSTRSRGSGLGLYICRELCERYGARIGYRRAEDRNEFSIVLRRATMATPS